MPSPLTSAERASAQRLVLKSDSYEPFGWDNSAYFASSQPGVLLGGQLQDNFVIEFKAGATYDIFALSRYNPQHLTLYNANGSALVWDDSSSLSTNTDSIKDFQATYTGDYYLAANWAQDPLERFVSLSVHEDIDTIDHSRVRYGSFGNDVFQSSSDIARFEGRAGYDVLDLLSTGRRSTVLELDSAAEVQLQHNGRTEKLASIEEVRFVDGRLVFAETDPAAQATRLYQAALGRLPDQAGLNFWIEKLEAGESLQTLARGFLGSDEFNTRFGGLSDADFVERMYLNVLGRGSDAAGKAGWLDYLQSGQGRDWVLQGFSESAENKARTVSLVQAGIWDLDEHAAQAARLYDTVLGRRPDEAGLAVQRGALDAGTSLQTLANNFVASAEFQAIYGPLDDRGFVSALYQNTLDRPGEAAGLEFWVSHLRSGMSRSEVVLGFSESAEHIALTSPFIMSDNPAEFGIAFA